MKNFFNKLVAALMMVSAMVGVSCSECDHVPYDDTEIKAQIADLYQKIAALESKLNADVASLQGMIGGLVTVKSHTQDANGNWTITLSDGTSFVVYAEYKPEALPTNLIYVMEVDGVKVWATMGADGKLVPLMDGDNYIPVVPEEVEIPEFPTLETKVDEDGKIWIKFSNSETWIETGFSADMLDELLPEDDTTGDAGAACMCNIVAVEYVYAEDEWGDEVAVAAIFTLGDGSTFTVDFQKEDGNKVGFYYEGQRDAITTFYLAPGATDRYIELRYENLVDIIKEVSEGWTVTIPEINPEENYVTVSVKAPSEEAIAANPAIANGSVKVFGVFEDGKSLVTKMSFTSGNPFKVVAATSKQVKVEAHTGVQGFVYGVMPASEYNAETIETTTNEALANYEALTVSSWDGLKLDTDPATVYGQELEEGVEYIFYVATYVERQVGYNFVSEVSSAFKTVTFTKQTASFAQTASTFNSINVDAKMGGFTTYYAVFSTKNEFNLDEWLSYSVNMYLGWGIDPECTYNLSSSYTYSGSVLGLPFVESSLQLNPATEYVICIVPAEEGKTEYTADDVYLFEEFKTADLATGGTVEVDATTVDADFTSASATLVANGASMIYYNFYKKAEVPATDEALVADLVATNYFAANGQDVYANDLEVGVEYVLAVLAVDANGAYKAPQQFAFTTKAVTFDSPVTVTIDEANSVINQKAGVLTWAAANGEVKEYLVYLAKTSAYAYANTMGGTPEAASKWMVVNQEMYQVKHLTENSITQNFYNTDPYILIVIAVDNDGKYAKPAVWEFTPAI